VFENNFSSSLQLKNIVINKYITFWRVKKTYKFVNKTDLLIIVTVQKNIQKAENGLENTLKIAFLKWHIP
jgi:hypothetical protein